MENAVSVLLVHSSVDIETRVAQVSDFLGQQFHSLKLSIKQEFIRVSYLGRVAEDNWLIDLQLGEKCIQAVYLNENIIIFLSWSI